MAIVIERTTPKVDSSSNVAVLSFTGTPTAGNDILVGAERYLSGGGGNTTVADNASGGSNTYNSIVQQQNSTPDCHASIHRADVVNTLSNLQVTVTAAVSSLVCAAAMEVSGLTSSPDDVAVSTGADTTSPWTQATGALAQADELIFAGFCFSAFSLANHGITIDSWSGGSPTTLFINDGAGINSEYGAFGYLIVSSTSSVTVSFSANNSGGGGSPVVVASFKGTPGPPSYDDSNPTKLVLLLGLPLQQRAFYDVKAWF